MSVPAAAVDADIVNTEDSPFRTKLLPAWPKAEERLSEEQHTGVLVAATALSYPPQETDPKEAVEESAENKFLQPLSVKPFTEIVAPVSKRAILSADEGARPTESSDFGASIAPPLLTLNVLPPAKLPMRNSSIPNAILEPIPSTVIVLPEDSALLST